MFPPFAGHPSGSRVHAKILQQLYSAIPSRSLTCVKISRREAMFIRASNRSLAASMANHHPELRIMPAFDSVNAISGLLRSPCFFYFARLLSARTLRCRKMPRPIIITAGIISSKIRYISISRADLPTNTRTHRHWWKIAISSLPVLSFQSHHPRQTRQAPSFRQAGYRCRDRHSGITEIRQ